MARGFFRLWIVIAVAWVAVVVAVFFPTFSKWGVPPECSFMMTAKQCSDELVKVGKNHFDAFDYGFYRGFDSQIVWLLIAIVVPPAALFMLGLVMRWVVKGFRSS